MDAHESLLHEFSSYYQADELPDFLYDGLDQQADGSVRRLIRRLGDSATEASTLLKDSANDRSHSLHQEIERVTTYGWTDTDEDWTLFRYLARRIADGIDSAQEVDDTNL